MISPYKIKWAGLSSLELDIWTELSFDGDSGQSSAFLNRENVTTEHYDGRKTMHRSKYTENLSPTITFIKQDYEDFTSDENRRILSWLTSSEKPEWLEVFHDDSEIVSYKLFGNWTEIEQYKLGGRRVVGYVATFESSHPYAWSIKNEVIKQITESTTFKLTCNSDEYNKLIYPKVTINFNGENIYMPINENPMSDAYQMIKNVIYTWNNNYYININGCKHQLSGIFGSSINNQVSNASTLNNYYYCSNNKTVYQGAEGNIAGTYVWKPIVVVGAGAQIKNSYKLGSENKTSVTEIAGNTLNEEIILDGTNKVLSSSISSNSAIGRLIGDDFNWIWIPLADGENNFTITGNCSIKFEWIEPRKVGNL